MALKGRFSMKGGYRVKICGTTNLNDALIAAREGADYFGVVVEVGFSKRSLSVEEAQELFVNPPIPAIALVFNMSEARLHYLIQKLRPYAVQFLSQEAYSLIRCLKKTYPKLQLWQSIHLPSAGGKVSLGEIKERVEGYIDAGADMLLYDTVANVQGEQKFGGTGMVSDWGIVKELINITGHKVPVLLAGGIKPENVEEALSLLEPDGIDLCSGVEAFPGKKDPEKIKILMEKIKRKGGDE